MGDGGRTLLDKVWDAHLVSAETEETPAVLYVDLHLVHEVTSPQAFAELRARGLRVRRPERTVATMDHAIPTRVGPDGRRAPAEGAAAEQVSALERNCREFGVTLYSVGDDAPGHRPRHRPRAGPHPPGLDDRLRRQPHEHPRRLRGPRLRHRHERGRPRARHAVPAPAQAEDLRGRARRVALRRRHRQGPDPRPHRPDRHGRGHRPRHRVPGIRRSAPSRWRSG